MKNELPPTRSLVLVWILAALSAWLALGVVVLCAALLSRLFGAF